MFTIKNLVEIIDLCLNETGIVLAAYIVFLLAGAGKTDRKRKLLGGGAAVGIGILSGLLAYLIPSMFIPVMMAVFYAAMGILFRIEAKKDIACTLLSFGISYVAYHLAVTLMMLLVVCNVHILSWQTDTWEEALRRSGAYLQSPWGILCIRLWIQGMTFVLLYALLRFEFLRKRLPQLSDFVRSEAGVYLTVAIVSVRTLISIAAVTNGSAEELAAVFLFVGMIMAFMTYFWIRKEERRAYRARLLEAELALLGQCMAEKERYLGVLRGDNERLAEMLHQDNKLIPSMVMGVKKAAASGEAMSLAAEETDALEALYQARRKVLSAYDAHAQALPQTGSTALDAVLFSLTAWANETGVSFTCDIGEDVADSLEDSIRRAEFNLLLASVCGHAIDAAQGGEVALYVGRSGERCRIEVRDSGGTLTDKALRRWGRQPFPFSGKTTGGAKRALTLFSLLRHTRATLVIEDYPADAGFPYTKAVRVMEE